MFYILFLVVFGLVIGLVSKIIHPGEDPVGFIPTVLIGVSGSFVGGAINWLIGSGGSFLQTSGFLMSIIGGVVCCAAWRWWKLRSSVSGPKNFFTGK